MENQSSSTESQSSETSENTTSPQINLLQAYIQSHDSQKASQPTEKMTYTGKHDASGHCQQVVHVPAHTRQGYPVAAYDRLCGQKHTVKEAAEKNQEEAEENKEQKTSNQKMTEKYVNLINEYWPHLKQNEGFAEEAYLDTLGNITIGPGRMINNESDFVALPLEVNGRPATIAEKKAEYIRLSGFKERGAYGKDYGFWKFQQKNESKKLRLPETVMVDMAMEHLEWDLGQLETKFPEFETYPRSLQMGLLDMQYNMGGNFTVEKWPSFHEGLKNKDITKMAEQSHRYQVGEDRNNWIRDTLLNIPLVDGWHYSSK